LKSSEIIKTLEAVYTHEIKQILPKLPEKKKEEKEIPMMGKFSSKKKDTRCP
jgi:hypothetical protein